MINFEDYPIELRPLSEDDGGGWLITFPDLPGCMSDGETLEEALKNGRDAFDSWVSARLEDGRSIPSPGHDASGKFIVRTPKSLHAKLAARAQQEGVSMNTMVITFIAEGLSR